MSTNKYETRRIGVQYLQEFNTNIRILNTTTEGHQQQKRNPFAVYSNIIPGEVFDS